MAPNSKTLEVIALPTTHNPDPTPPPINTEGESPTHPAQPKKVLVMSCKVSNNNTRSSQNCETIPLWNRKIGLEIKNLLKVKVNLA